MSGQNARYAVAAVHGWNHAAYARHKTRWPGDWTLFESPDELTDAAIRDLAPRYVFFPHWSWRVPDEILEAAECVCFHMTDVPYGRGGSPLQNLVLRGHTETMVSALRMVSELDAGPVYLKKPLSLEGRAQSIYERAADVVFGMIGEIVANEPEPVPQSGEAVIFPRRTPAESALPAGAGPAALYDHIRMLDAEGYPHAFLEHDGMRLEFTGAQMAADGTVSARVTFAPESKAGRPTNKEGQDG